MKYIITFLFICYLQIGLFAQKSVHFFPKQKFIKETDIVSSTSMSTMGQVFSYDMQANLYTSYFVRDTFAGRYLINITIDSINSELTTNGIKMEFDSKDTANFDSTDIFAKPLYDMIGKTTYLEIDYNGNILKTDTSSTVNRVKSLITQVIALGNIDYSIGSKFELLQNIPDTANAGYTWTDSISTILGKKVLQYNLVRQDHNTGTIDINGNLERKMYLQQKDATIPATFKGNMQGRIDFQSKTDVIFKRQYSLDMNAEVSIKDVQIPVKTKSSIVEIIKEI